MNTKTLSFLAITLLLGCSKQSPPPSSTTNVDLESHSVAPPAATPATPEPAQRGPVKLLENGEEPRRQLEYKIPNNLVENLAIEIIAARASRTPSTDSISLAMSPPIRMNVEVGPVSINESEGIQYDFLVSNIQFVEPQDATEEEIEVIEEALEPITRIAGTVNVNQQGVTEAYKFNIPSSLNNRTLNILGNIRTSLMSVPFPSEEVGVGSRWEVVRTFNNGGVTVNQTVTYSLIQSSGDQGRLVVTVRQSAHPQERSTSQARTVFVDAYETTGVGYIDYDLGHITPYSQIDFGAFARGTVETETTTTPTVSRSWGTIRVYPVAQTVSQ